jgi:predicted AAA+ superfamily ATPase
MEEIFNSLKIYNFWEKQQPKLGFIRQVYLERISKFSGNSLVKVISGQRRCGKSYLLRQIASQLIKNGIAAKNVFYINKEYIEFDDIKNYRDLDQLIKKYEQIMKPKGKIYLFIDERQNIDQWERLVNSYAQNFAREYAGLIHAMDFFNLDYGVIVTENQRDRFEEKGKVIELVPAFEYLSRPI